MRKAAALAALLLASTPCAAAELTPTGMSLTPRAAAGAVFQSLDPGLQGHPEYRAGQASALAVSPDGSTLLVMTSGFNRLFDAHSKPISDASDEYVFVDDIRGAAPVVRQVIHVADTFLGLAWAPSGERFYVSGGKDDVVLEYGRGAGGWAPARRFPLGHKEGLGVAVKPMAAGLAVSPDGRWLVVANMQNDSVTLIDLAAGKVATEQDLRPGKIDPTQVGRPGGTFPRAVTFVSNGLAVVGAERDREVIALAVSREGRLSIAWRRAVCGQPTAFARSGDGRRLYAALDDTDEVAVIDPDKGWVLENIASAAPAAVLKERVRLGGAGSNALALTPDGRTLLVSDGGLNAVAVIALDGEAAGKAGGGEGASRVVGLIPTGWYPTAVAIRPDGGRIFVANGKTNAGPNPHGCRRTLGLKDPTGGECPSNDYVWQLEKAGLLSLPPPRPAELARLTAVVAANDGFAARPAPEAERTFAFLRARIRHVVFVVKENRTYDQVLGDLPVGNGDPKLALFGAAMTPNHHALASQFVDLDAFFDSGESSNTGWDWTTAGRTNDFTEREAPVNYGERGLQYDQEGTNRNINVGWATSAERRAVNPISPADPDILPGARDVAGLDGPEGEEGRGYLWDAAIQAGLWVRNYGFFGDIIREFKEVGSARLPLLREPWKTKTRVFFPAKAALMDKSDPYYRGFDQALPDYWRVQEWKREWATFVAQGKAPNLMLLRLAHDHTGDFREGLDGVNTVETELADNDYALGLVIEQIVRSPFAADTLVFVIEDDAQDGPDHVDAHRSLALVAGPYVRRHAVVSTRHDTVDLLRTMEEILGLEPLSLDDAVARPMAEIFDPRVKDWSYKAEVPAVLRTTALPLPPVTRAEAACVGRSSLYWQAAMAGQDFSAEDRLDTARYNRALWRGIRGDAPYPERRTGEDLSRDRPALLAAAREVCPGAR